MSVFNRKILLLFLSAVTALCDGQLCPSGNVALAANQCTDPDELFNGTVSVLPESNTTFTCSVTQISVFWNSSQFTMPMSIDSVANTMVESNGITLEFDTFSETPTCTTATATISNIQDSMDGLDLKCFTPVGFSRTVMLNVIDPPLPVDFIAIQDFGDIVISWNNSMSSDGPCPIIEYALTIDGSTVSVNGTETNYSRPIFDSECGSTLPITMSATSAAGTGENMTMNLAIVSAPADLSLCAVMEFSGSFLMRHLDAKWMIPLERTPELSLTFEVNSVTQSTSLPSSTTTYMYPIEDQTFPGMFDVMVYFDGQMNNTCFSTYNQINVSEEFSMVNVTNVEVDSGEASITLIIDNSVFTVIDSDLQLSFTCGNGGGVCKVSAMPSQQQLDLICNGLSADTCYDLTIDLSVSDNCHMILIHFDTPSMTPLPSSTSSTGTRTPDPTASPSTGLDLPVIIGLVVAVVVVLLVIIAVVLMIGIYWFKRKGNKARLDSRTKDEGDGPVALVEKTNPKTGEVSTYDDPADIQPKEIPHKDAPTGDTYAVVDKASTRRAAPSTPPQFEPMTYQDPEKIQRKEAPTGDMYAVVNKDPKPVYSEVNKPQDGRVYADLALPKSGEGGASRQPASQEVFYSQVHQL